MYKRVVKRLFWLLCLCLTAAGCTETNTGYVSLILAADETYTRQTLELIKKDLGEWDFITNMTIAGLSEQAFDIEFNREIMKAFGLNYDSVVRQVQTQVREKSADLKRPLDFNAIRIQTEKGYTVTLAQIATITLHARDKKILYQGKQVYKIIIKYDKAEYFRLLEQLEAYRKQVGVNFLIIPLKDLELNLHLLSSEHKQDADLAMNWFLEHHGEAHNFLLEIVQKREYDLGTIRAVKLLGLMGIESDVAVLKELVAGGPRWLTTEAALSLALHPAEGAYTALMEFTADPDPEIATVCITALGKRKDEQARPCLEALLESPSESIRYKAVHALSLLGAAPSSKALETRLAREPSAEIRALIQSVIE